MLDLVYSLKQQQPVDWLFQEIQDLTRIPEAVSTGFLIFAPGTDLVPPDVPEEGRGGSGRGLTGRGRHHLDACHLQDICPRLDSPLTTTD